MSEALNPIDIEPTPRRSAPGGKGATAMLTQREIDAILQKTTPEPLAPVLADDVVPYNFSRPPRVSKDRRANLESLYARFALSLQGLFASLLRQPLDVVVGSVEQAMFSEYILSLGTPCASFVFEVGDRMGSQGAIDLSTDFAFHLVDRLLGGPGDPQSLQRPLTQLEQAVVRNVTERTLGILKESWTENLVMAPQITGFESNPEMLQIASREDNVLVTNLEIRSVTFRTTACSSSVRGRCRTCASPGPPKRRSTRWNEKSVLRSIAPCVPMRSPRSNTNEAQGVPSDRMYSENMACSTLPTTTSRGARMSEASSACSDSANRE
jgi:hypothetical protein